MTEEKKDNPKGKDTPCARQGKKGKFSNKPRKTTNDKKWYSKAGVPKVGANFAILQDLRATPVVGENGIHLDFIARHITAPVIPCDSKTSVAEQFRHFYSEIRERNSGAANYTYVELMHLVLNLRSAYINYHQAKKMVQAVQTKVPGSAQGARLMAYTTGVSYSLYDDIAGNLANLKNDLQLLQSDLMTYPVPPMAVFERDKFVYGTIFLDSKSPKPALASFLPWVAQKYTVDTATKGEHVIEGVDFTAAGSINDPATYIARAREALAEIDKVVASPIIRGDLRNVYGNTAALKPESVDSPLPISQEDPEVMAQLENAAVLGGEGAVPSRALRQKYTQVDDTLDVAVQFGGVTQPDIASRAQFDERLINKHTAEMSDEDLLAITRFDVVATKENKLSKSWWLLGVADGNVIIDSIFVYAAADGSLQSYEWGPMNIGAHGATPASDLRHFMAVAGVQDHLPMFIHDEDSPDGFFWDVDDFAVITADDLDTYTAWSIKSQFSAPAPRGEAGRIERYS